jgi:AcrR family transcriptional regulator
MGTDTTERILEATHRALCEYGYAGLTTERIAAEAGTSKAALHYHYDTKEALLRSYLEFLLDGFEARLACGTADPDERLGTFVDAVFGTERDGRRDFAVALLELKAQAPYTDPYRERFRALDARMRETVAGAVRDGVASGRYPAVDPEYVARFVVTLINGGTVREVALGERPDEARRLVVEFLDTRLECGLDGVGA